MAAHIDAGQGNELRLQHRRIEDAIRDLRDVHRQVHEHIQRRRIISLIYGSDR